MSYFVIVADGAGDKDYRDRAAEDEHDCGVVPHRWSAWGLARFLLFNGLCPAIVLLLGLFRLGFTILQSGRQSGSSGVKSPLGCSFTLVRNFAKDLEPVINVQFPLNFCSTGFIDGEIGNALSRGFAQKMFLIPHFLCKNFFNSGFCKPFSEVGAVAGVIRQACSRTVSGVQRGSGYKCVLKELPRFRGVGAGLVRGLTRHPCSARCPLSRERSR